MKKQIILSITSIIISITGSFLIAYYFTEKNSEISLIPMYLDDHVIMLSTNMKIWGINADDEFHYYAVVDPDGIQSISGDFPPLPNGPRLNFDNYFEQDCEIWDPQKRTTIKINNTLISSEKSLGIIVQDCKGNWMIFGSDVSGRFYYTNFFNEIDD